MRICCCGASRNARRHRRGPQHRQERRQRRRATARAARPGTGGGASGQPAHPLRGPLQPRVDLCRARPADERPGRAVASGSRVASGAQGRQRLQAMADWCQEMINQYPLPHSAPREAEAQMTGAIVMQGSEQGLRLGGTDFSTSTRGRRRRGVRLPRTQTARARRRRSGCSWDSSMDRQGRRPFSGSTATAIPLR